MQPRPALELAPDENRPVALPPDLETPCLVADIDIVEGNIRRMQAVMDTRGIALRPHAKTHKSVPVARMQIEAGAVGLTVGTLTEAEVFADAGFDDLFVAYPIWPGGRKATRLRNLMSHVRLRVGVDSVAGASHLADAVSEADQRLQVLIEVDSGEHRTGANPERAADVAAAAERGGLDVRGLFTHGGHSYDAPAGVEAAANDEVRTLETAKDVLGRRGFPVEVVSAGSSPTAVRSARGGVTEERPGTYVFGDRQQIVLGSARPEGVALTVASTVVSRSSSAVVLDAGAKSLSKDRKPWMNGHGLMPAYPALSIDALFDYHAVVSVPAGVDAPVVGEQVAVIPNHVCPVVNLFDHIEVARAGEVVGRWDVDARGCNT